MTGSPRGGWIALVAFLSICLLAGAIGGVATASSVETWYPGVNKPSWNPPAAVFGPVWTALYIMMAGAAWMVWRRRMNPAAGPALRLFGLQLGLNTLWSLMFFGLRQPGFAFLEILFLWLAIAATLRSFGRIHPPAGWLLLPYLAWVTFATVLNFAIWRLNA